MLGPVLESKQMVVLAIEKCLREVRNSLLVCSKAHEQADNSTDKDRWKSVDTSLVLAEERLLAAVTKTGFEPKPASTKNKNENGGKKKKETATQEELVLGAIEKASTGVQLGLLVTKDAIHNAAGDSERELWRGVVVSLVAAEDRLDTAVNKAMAKAGSGWMPHRVDSSKGNY
jgi:hypothetical protein